MGKSKAPLKKEDPGFTETSNTAKKNPAYKKENNGQYLKKVYRYGRFNSTQKEILCDLEINNTKLSAKVAEEAEKTENIIKITEVLYNLNAPREHLLQIQNEARKKFETVVKQADYQTKVIDEAERWQKKLARKLANQIEHDVENTAYDANKLRKYKQQAGLKINEEDEDAALFKTQTLYTLFAWYTSARLFFVRLNRAFSEIGLGFLPKFFSYLGLSYGLEVVLVDLPAVLFSTFRPLRQSEEKMMQEKGISLASIRWWRFKNAVTKDNRIPRVLNAIVWFSVNLSAIVLTGGIGLLAVPAITAVCNQMNIGGFAFDVFNDFYCWARDYIENTRALKIINKKIDKLKTPEKYKEKLNDKLQFLKRGKENASGETREKVDKLIQALQNKINLEDFNDKVKLKRASRELVKQELEEKISLKIGPFSIPLPTRVYSIGVASFILLGMALFWFPVASAIKACEAAGSLVSLIGGSMLGGFGRRVMNGIESVISSFKGTEKPNEIAKEEIIKTEEVRIPNTYAIQYKDLLPLKKDLPSEQRKTEEPKSISESVGVSSGLSCTPPKNISRAKSVPSSTFTYTLLAPSVIIETSLSPVRSGMVELPLGLSDSETKESTFIQPSYFSSARPGKTSQSF